MRPSLRILSCTALIMAMSVALGCATCKHSRMFERAYQTMHYDDHDAFRRTISQDETIINMANHDQWSLLMYAVQENKLKYVDELLDLGANVNYTISKEDLTPLHLSRTTEVAGRLIDKGANINATGFSGTPLMFCMQMAYDGPQVALWLIRQGANVNISSSDGVTPLMVAVSLGPQWRTVVEALLRSGADVNAQRNDGQTALHQLVKDNKIDLDVLRMLLDHGGNAMAEDNGEMTPLKMLLESIRITPTGNHDRAIEIIQESILSDNEQQSKGSGR